MRDFSEQFEKYLLPIIINGKSGLNVILRSLNCLWKDSFPLFFTVLGMQIERIDAPEERDSSTCSHKHLASDVKSNRSSMIFRELELDLIAPLANDEHNNGFPSVPKC
jgi:hypothetical protein